MSYFILLKMALPGVTYREGFTLATIYQHYQIRKRWNMEQYHQITDCKQPGNAR